MTTSNDSFRHKLADMEDLDESTIASKPWAQHLLATALRTTRKAVLNWCTIVGKVGEADLDTDAYVGIFLHQIEALYEEMIMDVEAIQEKSLDRIMKLLQQMQQLCKELHLEMPQFNYEEVALSELRKVLVHRVEEYEALASVRRLEMQQLHHKQMELCKRLGREPLLLVVGESPTLPKPEQIETLRGHIEVLETEAMEREEKFFQLKEQIVEIANEMAIPPSLDFEQEILTMPNTEVKITDLDMELLHLYHTKLVAQADSIKAEIVELRGKVDELWDKLETDIAERDSLRQKSIGNSLTSLKALKEEVARLEEIKKANIKVFIHKQREELSELWHRCQCTDEDRRKFTFYHSECYNEDLFELHEREIHKWRAYFEENKELFGLLEQHKKLWNDLRDMELNSGGANRYKNRGGQLLIEEKLRNRLSKRIPKVEEQLVRMAEVYLQRKGRTFRTFGETVQEYIERLHLDRDKELKLSAKKPQKEHAASTIVGRSRMNLLTPSGISLNPTLTPRSCTTTNMKRKVAPSTPHTEPIKKLKTTGAKVKNAPTSKTGVPKLNVSKNKRRSSRRRRQRLSFNKSNNKENNNTTMTSTSYEDFTRQVSTRSTAYVLKDHNNVSPLKNGDFLIPGVAPLQKTPVKRALRNRF